MRVSSGVSAQAAWSRCAWVVAVVALLCVAAAAPRAEARLPSGALARLGPGGWNDTAAYGPADPCSQCEFSYGNYAEVAPYVLADRADGRLVTARMTRSTLRLTAFSTTTFRPTARRSATFPGWQIGGALITRDGIVYVLLGRLNVKEDDARTVIEVRKLDARLKQLGRAEIPGKFEDAGIYQPFEATDSSMALSGTTLVVHTARLIYHVPKDSAPHHQVNLSFSVDTTSMMPELVQRRPYASHSFRQFVRAQGADAVFLDHGDAYPRAVQLGVIPGYFTPDHGKAALDRCNGEGPLEPLPESECVSVRRRDYEIFTFGGNVGDNYTGTTVNGFEVGATHALMTGVSVPHGEAVRGVRGNDSRFVRNAYLISTDTARGTSRFTWLTTYRPKARGISVGQPQLVPVGDDRFAVLFATKRGRSWAMRYVLVNETGDVLAARTWRGARFTALAQPVVAGTRLFWVGSERRSEDRIAKSDHYLYGLDTRNVQAPQLLRR